MLAELLTHPNKTLRRFAKGEKRFSTLILEELTFKEFPTEELTASTLIIKNCSNLVKLPKKLKVKELLIIENCPKINAASFSTNSIDVNTLSIKNCQSFEKFPSTLKILKRIDLVHCHKLKEFCNFNLPQTILSFDNLRGLKKIENIKCKELYVEAPNLEEIFQLKAQKTIEFTYSLEKLRKIGDIKAYNLTLSKIAKEITILENLTIKNNLILRDFIYEWPIFKNITYKKIAGSLPKQIVLDFYEQYFKKHNVKTRSFKVLTHQITIDSFLLSA